MKLQEEEKDEIVKEQQFESKSAKKRGLFSSVKSWKQNRKEKKLAKIEAEKPSDAENKQIEERLEVASKEVSSSSQKGKKIKQICFFILNLALVAGILVWNIFSSDDFTPINVFEIHFEFVVFALLMLAAVVLVDVISVHHMIYRKTLRSRWALSYKSVATLRYYDAVTPLSAGGQAFMVTYLTNRDVPGSTALSIPIAKLLFQNTAWLIVGFFCLIFGTTSASFVSVTSILGFVFGVLTVAVILFVSLSKKTAKKVIDWCLKLLVKMKLVKNYDKINAKVTGFVQDYQNIMKEYSTSKLEVVIQITLHGIRHICLYTIPFFIYCAFLGYNPAKFGEFFMFTSLIELSSSFIPLPGGTGMNEITFTVLFSQYLGGNTFWALLFWRFCSYYFYLLQGIGLMTYDTVYGNRKYRWIKKKLELQRESQAFRHAQIDSFRKERNKRRLTAKRNASKLNQSK